jgi:hypothetical protein
VFGRAQPRQSLYWHAAAGKVHVTAHGVAAAAVQKTGLLQAACSHIVARRRDRFIA